MSQDPPEDKPATSSQGSEASDDEATRSPDRDVYADPERKKPRWERRREKIREEIERNRRGEYKVPTWVLTVALVAFIAAWALLIILA